MIFFLFMLYEALVSTAIVYAVFNVTWILFVALMALRKYNKESELTLPVKVFAYPWLALGYVMDFASNIFATIVFLEIPQDWLLTARLKRHQREQPGSRKARWALWVCKNLLNPFDLTGQHC